MAGTERKLSISDSLSARDVQTDVVEWWCTAILRETSSPELLEQRVQGFESAVLALGEEQELLNYGRLYNRMALACFYADISQRLMDGEDDDDEDALSKLEPETWALRRQQLANIKTSLLRKDVNASEQDTEDATVDEKLASLTKFTTDYDAVDSLLALHQIVARFRQVLQGLAPTKNQKELLHQVEQAVDDYTAALVKINLTDSVPVEKLTSFLLKDMYKTKAKDLPQRLVQHLYDVMANDENEVAYAQIRSKARRLVQRWHSCVLQVPTLVRLGYGGISTKRMSVLEGRRSSLFDENASVSSWGVDEEEFKEREKVEMGQDDAPQKTSTDDEDTDGYATANEEDVNAALAFSTQPPVEENLPPVEEEEEEEEEETDDGDKKPRAKPTKEYKSHPRRSSRLAGPVTVRDSQRATRLSAAAQSQKKVNAKEEDNDESSVESKESPAKKPPAAGAAKKSDDDDDDDESITEPETRSSSSPKRARKPVAKPGTSVVGWSSESDDEPCLPKKRPRKRKSEAPSRRSQKLKKKRNFTEEEMEAIRAGVRRFGKGDWTTIRINSGGVLMNRTNVNIKDCYRNMEKRGEGV
jgi:hypothetical protein